MQSKRQIRGFTLIELLVVVAVISLLLGMLLPSVRWSREVAQSMVGSSNTRQLVIGQLSYAADHEGWLAGPNTTGLEVKAKGTDGITGGTTGDTPTSTHDWISPTVGSSLSFSANRAERTRDIFERFADPKAIFPYTTLFPPGGGGFADSTDFKKQSETSPYLQLSYLSPGSFHYVSPNSKWSKTINGKTFRVGSGSTSDHNSRLETIHKGFGGPFAPPKNYRPRLDLLKNPSGKVAVADGTRYVDYQGGRTPKVIFDFDVDPIPGVYGSFLASGPIFHQSVEYGRSHPRAGGNTHHIDLSMRYFDNEMHISFWDGHATRISHKEAWTDPVPWYPRGSVYTGTASNATPEVDSVYESDEILP